MAGVGFNTGLKALLASQVALDTVGHNIANAGIKGYSQQKVQFQTSRPLGVRGLMIGSGVEATSIQRSFDGVLESRIHSRLGIGSSFEARANAYFEIETLMAEPNGFSLGDTLDDFFASTSDLASAPDDGVLRTGMSQAAMDLTTVFNQLAGSLSTFGDDIVDQVKADTQKVNSFAAEIVVLNEQIAETEASGIPANDLRDQRGLVIEALSEVVGVKVHEAASGAITVTVGGATLVGSKGSYKMTADANPGGTPVVRLQGVVGDIDVSGGSMGARLEMTSSSMPAISAELDELAKELIFQINKVHSTGVPGSGPYSQLVAENAIGDMDKDGKFEDELLNNGSLPFDVQSGELYVTVTESASGEITKHKVEINAAKTTMGELVEMLDDVPHINVEIGNLGQLRIISDAGYGYDFSPTLDANPDNAGAFGGGKASLGTQAPGPFSLLDGQTLDLTVDVAGTPTTVSIPFALNDFEDITEASAEELAAVINADAGAQSVGLAATVVGEHLFLQSAGSGGQESFSVAGGSAVAGLGWSSLVGTPIEGAENAVLPVISGQYTGDQNSVYSFVPVGDGTIGTTPGLAIEVFDEFGGLVVTLDVGEGYVPGAEITVANGVSVSFGLGELSATNGDRFDLDVVGDPDTSDVLVALGLGSLLTGSSASDIGLREDIEMDPDLIAAGFGGGEADGGALLELFSLKDQTHSALGGESFDEFYSTFIGDIGFETQSAQTAYQANEALLASLEMQREQISGVNVDEELIDMMRYEQSYQAAIQYISVVDSLNETILSLI